MGRLIFKRYLYSQQGIIYLLSGARAGAPRAIADGLVIETGRDRMSSARQVDPVFEGVLVYIKGYGHSNAGYCRQALKGS